ncbi:alpha/beta hydrolase [Actinomadura keratinilytica]|uniref:alpha/beta hydrolase n=1 Tax=Actinomadura keratinilytica TaxID=547461 RepID=UPI003CD0B8D0
MKLTWHAHDAWCSWSWGPTPRSRTSTTGPASRGPPPRGRGSALWRQAHAVTPDPGIAVVAWLGYAAPRTSSSDVLTDVTSPTPG